MRRTLAFCCVAALVAHAGIVEAQTTYRGWPNQTSFNPMSQQQATGMGLAYRGDPSTPLMQRLPMPPQVRPRSVNYLLNSGPQVGPPLPVVQQPAQVTHIWNDYPAKVLTTGRSSHGCKTPNCCAPTWCASIGGVYMTRESDDNLWLSYDQFSIADRVLTSNHADYDWSAGAEASVRRYFNCGKNSIEFAYWGIYPEQEEAWVLGVNTVGGLDTILHFDGLSYDPGGGPALVGGGGFFNAEHHRVQREYQIHNVELNLLGHNFCTPCSGLKLGWTAGVRYVRLEEDFLYSTDPIDTVFTGDPEELHYGIDVENNLIGFQLGGRGDYCWKSVTLFADTKVGLYANRVTQEQAIFGTNGFAFVSDPLSPYFNEDVNISSRKDDVALLGELKLGANWNFHKCWKVGLGYRVVGMSGVAVATHQVPRDFIGALPSLEAVDTNCGILLHGGFLNVEYCR